MELAVAAAAAVQRVGAEVRVGRASSSSRAGDRENWMSGLGLPDRPNYDVQTFDASAPVTNLSWLTWRKPLGVSMCSILCIGGGGGGGAGFSAAAGNARGGGGSGGSSAVARLVIPVNYLPDVLYIQVGAGGAGGAGTGGSGILSYVAISPDLTAQNVVAVSGSAGAVGGTVGAAANGGAGGTAGTIAVIGSMPFAGLGFFNLVAGQVGVAGGAQTGVAGTNQTIPVTSVVTTGGTGGGGVTAADRAGGGFTTIASSYLSEQAPIAAAAGSNPGSGGVLVQKPWFAFGGCGGGSSNAGVGGNGGPGAPGAGGGGGGGGTTGGTGGNGGNGIVIIVCW
jgi:hypothetical protein